jgi:pimeloyl-ACP methyl ester carboxylesterase
MENTHFCENLFIENSAGQKMHMRITTPEGWENRMRCAFIQHGRSGSIDYPHNKVLERAYLDRGYCTIMIDSTNSQNNISSGRLEDFTIPRHVGDMSDAISWSQAFGICPAEFALAGHSMGAYSALDLASGSFRDDPKLLHALGAAPVTSGLLQVQTRERNFPDLYKDWQDKGYMVEPSDDGTIQATLSWESFQGWRGAQAPLENINVPVALIGGEKDTWVPARDIEAAAQRTPKAAVTYARDATHTFAGKTAELRIAVDQTLDWLESLDAA